MSSAGSVDRLESLRNDPVLGQYVGKTFPSVRAAITSSEGLTTESIARERQLSDSLGIPPRLLRPNRERAEQEVLALRIQDDPVLGPYAGLSPENAAIVRDDEPGLLGVVKSVFDAAAEAGRDVGEAWDTGFSQMELADL